MTAVLPEGLTYTPDFVTPEEERELIATLETMEFREVTMRGQTARRVVRHFGLDYDYESRTPLPGEPIPAWLEPVRAKAAAFAGFEPEELVEILVQRYPPGATIGWHRDAPAFGTVVGVSLLGSCRLRFQRGTGERRRVWEITLPPRSGYVLAGEARRSWQHSIPPTKELRYSITFRTLRR